MNSPFQYGRLAAGTTFVSRQLEKQQLIVNLSSGTNTIIISPRRCGKTSLVKEAMSELIKEHLDISVCYIDAFKVRNEHEFYMLYVKEIIKSTSATPESFILTAKEFLGDVAPRFSTGSDTENDFTIELEQNLTKGNETYILDLPERIADKTGMRIIVCVDEFQNLARLKEFPDLEYKIHRAWQRHLKVNFCLSGSKRQVMGEIFNTPQNPFYQFGETILLPKVDENEWIQYIIDLYKRTGKSISKLVATELVQKVKCHTWYVPQYAHFAWILTSNNTTDNILYEAFTQLVNTNLPLYKRECEAMTSSQLSLLIAIANNEKAFTSTAVMQTYGLGTPQNVSKNKELLQRRDLVEKTTEGFVFLDPVFELWFTAEYLHK